MGSTEQLSWMLKVLESECFIFITSIFELLSSVAAVIGVIAIIITIMQYKHEKKQTDYAVEFKKKELAVELLDEFAKEIIPSINKLNNNVQVEFENHKQLDISSDKLAEITVRVKIENDIIDIFNSLEQISVYIKNDIVNTDILFDPISEIVCSFVKEHDDVFTRLLVRSPFSNLTYVVERWSSEQQIQMIEQQEELLRSRKKAILKNKK